MKIPGPKTLLISLPFALIVIAILSQDNLSDYVRRKLYPEEIRSSSLKASLILSEEHFLSLRKPDSPFVSEFDMLTGKDSTLVNQYRQTTGIWALALLAANGSDAASKAAQEAIERQLKSSAESKDGKMIVFADTPSGRTGAQAVFVLALSELASHKGPFAETARKELEPYAKFLLSLRTEDGRFRSKYDYDGTGRSAPSAEYDGSALLALTRAAIALKNDGMKAAAEESLRSLWKLHVEEALKRDPASEDTRVFYRWGLLSVLAMREAEMPAGSEFTARAIELGKWIKEKRGFPEHSRNTADAYAGLAAAWRLAEIEKDAESADLFRDLATAGMWKVLRLQVGSPMEFHRIAAAPNKDPRSRGGAVLSRDSSVIRTDLSQEVLHAVLLLKDFY